MEGRAPRYIDGSGKNIYFSSGQQLTQDDTDSVADVYDARIDGGFSFARHEGCAGEACQPSQLGRRILLATPGTHQSKGNGNYQRATVSVKALSSSQLAKLAAGGKIGLGVKVSGGGKISAKGTTLIHGKQVRGHRRDFPCRTGGPGEPADLALPEWPVAASKQRRPESPALRRVRRLGTGEFDLEVEDGRARPKRSKKGNG